MKRWSHWLILPLALALWACAGVGTRDQTGRPDWVLNPPGEPGYLYGVGSAPIGDGGLTAAETVAEGEALVTIIQQIGVKASASDEARVSRTRRNGKTTELVRTIDRMVQQQVPDIELHHLEVVERFEDRTHQRLYVLRRLDLGAEQADVRRQLGKTDMALMGYEETLKNASPDVTGLRSLAPALTLLRQRELLQDQLNRLSPGEAEPELTSEWSGLRAGILQRFSALKVTIEAPDAEPAITAALGARLSALGLGVVGQGEAADLTVGYDITLREVEQDGVVYAYAEGGVTMQAEDGASLYSHRMTIKRAATNAELARDRAINALADALADALVSTLLGQSS